MHTSQGENSYYALVECKRSYTRIITHAFECLMQHKCIVIIELSLYNHALYLTVSYNLIAFWKHHIDISGAKLCVIVEEGAALVVMSCKIPVGALFGLNQVSSIGQNLAEMSKPGRRNISLYLALVELVDTSINSF